MCFVFFFAVDLWHPPGGHGHLGASGSVTLISGPAGGSKNSHEIGKGKGWKRMEKDGKGWDGTPEKN